MRHVFTFLTALTVGLSGCASDGLGAAPPRHPAHSTQITLHRLWVRSITPNADSVPAFAAHPQGHRNPIVYVLAGNNGANCNPGSPVRVASLYAFSAGGGKLLWIRHTRGPSRCTTAGPAVEPSGRWVYAPGLDGKIHRYDTGSGKEQRSHGWPKRVTLMPDVEKMSATPTISNGYLYVTTSGFIGDQGHYQGHLVTIKLSNGGAHVFNSLCSNIHALLGPTPGRSNYCPYAISGLFGRGQGVTDPVGHDVYVVSGNGPWNGRSNWGDSILRISPAGTRLVDSYTPTNQSYLADRDLDLGSTGPAILPTVRANGRSYHLLVQGGKGPACARCSGAVLRLLNRDNLSGKGGPGRLGGDLQDLSTPGGCEVLTAPAVWRARGHDWVFYANDCGSAAYRLDEGSSGRFRLTRVWRGSSGTTPVYSKGVLYLASDGAVLGLNATNGAVLTRASIGSVHWEYPLVTHGRLFVTDENGHVYAYRIGA